MLLVFLMCALIPVSYVYVAFVCVLAGSSSPKGLRLSLILIPLTTLECWTAQPSENATAHLGELLKEMRKQRKTDEIERDFDSLFLYVFLPPALTKGKLKDTSSLVPWYFD